MRNFLWGKFALTYIDEIIVKIFVQVTNGPVLVVALPTYRQEGKLTYYNRTKSYVYEEKTKWI